jgi:aconitate hydratase
VQDRSRGLEFAVLPQLGSERDLELIRSGGALSWASQMLEKSA